MERNCRKLMRMLKKDGWEVDRVKGDHCAFKHPDKAELITLTRARKDLPPGLVRSLCRIAGWKI